jgi:hypothetical protein
MKATIMRIDICEKNNNQIPMEVYGKRKAQNFIKFCRTIISYQTQDFP